MNARIHGLDGFLLFCIIKCPLCTITTHNLLKE